MLGQAAIPLGLLLLGMQLERMISRARAERMSSGARRDLAGGLIAGVLRIAGGFSFAILIIRFFEFDPLLRKVLIVESAMPTAVNAIVYATEFECRPRLVAVGIMASTFASIVSITLILRFLG
jgi:predicted permease